MSSLAQEESRSISENVRWGYRKRFSDGKVSLAYSHFLGYDKGENGTLKVVPEQARIVRIIYKKFLDGQTTQSIARDLTEQGIPTPMGKANWSASTILSILQNEKYKGDALLQKSFTTDYLTKKMKKNEGEIPQYLVEGAHEAIIDPEQFELVQEELARRREMGRSYKDIVFHGKIVCGDCGGLYGKKLWHSTDKYRKLVFQCNEKFKQSNKCATPKFSEEEIKTRFLLAYNKLLQNRSSVLSDCETVRKMLCDTEVIEMQISETETEIAVAAEMMSEHVKKNASIALSQDRYAEEALRIEQRYNDAVDRRRELIEERDRRKRKDKELKAYIHSIKKGPLILDEWDEQLWITILDTATVYRDGRIEFCFKGGKRITG